MNRIREWLEFVGLVAVVLSLVFVGVELRQSREIAADASFSTSANTLYEGIGIVADHADVWRRGCIGETLDPNERLVFTQIFHGKMFEFFMNWMRSGPQIGRISGSLAIDNVAINLHRNPGLAAAWADLAAWRSYAREATGNDLIRWRAAVDARVAHWREVEPEPLVMPERCGLF